MNIAYVLLRFPSLTETFIAEEIQKMHGMGVNVHIYSLLPPTEKSIHPVSQSLEHLCRQVPGLLSFPLWTSQLFYLTVDMKGYFKALIALMRQPVSARTAYLKRWLIFLKSVWIAHDLRHQQIELIHSHFAWLSGAGGWIVSRFLKVPFTVTTHAFDIFTDRNDLLNLLTDAADTTITISKYNKEIILKKNPTLPPEKVQIIRCGIDLDFFSNDDNNLNFSDPIQITSVGSLIEKKGHEYLISACECLQKLGVRFNCVIIGTGELEKVLLQKIKEKGLQEVVFLAGRRSQEWIRDRLRQTDVFVLGCVRTSSSDQDGIPVAMMEAMGMGRPVISTRVSGIPELIKHEVTGLLVNERAPEEIAGAIIRLSQDQKLRNTLAINGYELIKTEYNIMANVRKLNDLFSSIIEEYTFHTNI